jgi:hypothetical protein
MIGCFIPKSSVMRVLIDVRLSWRPVTGDARTFCRSASSPATIANQSSIKLPNWHNIRVDGGTARGVTWQAVRMVDAVADQPRGQVRATVPEHSSLTT